MAVNGASAIGDNQFPRTATIPVQSPLYWVSQKDRYLRQMLIRDIEALTGRRLIVYFANRYVAGGSIDAGDVSYLVELLSDVSPDEPVDFLLETPGGQTDATEALISILQTRIPGFRAVIANAAKSNGTLISLAASSIVMGAASELGPIDPALGGTPCSILAMDQFAMMNFPLHQLGLLALNQTKKLAERLLRDGMLSDKPGEVERVARTLGSRDVYFSHGSTIDHREAADLGLKIEYLPPEDEVWQRLWLLYTMYDFDVKRDGYVKIFEGRGRSTSVSPSLPSGPTE